jgi:hypothetical protein
MKKCGFERYGKNISTPAATVKSGSSGRQGTRHDKNQFADARSYLPLQYALHILPIGRPGPEERARQRRASHPADPGRPGSPDERRLGLAVTSLRLSGRPFEELPVGEPELTLVGAPAPAANPSVYSFPILS